MAKDKITYTCSNCGGTTPKLMGKCPHCNSWGTILEEVAVKETSSNNRYSSITKISSKVEDLDSINSTDQIKKSSNISELDRVLGGGFVDGSVVLLGGDPGIGKSTLLLQTLSSLAKDSSVLYISGEESSEQIALRGRRLNLPLKGIKIYSEIELKKIISTLESSSPKYVVIDSIQTLFSSELTSAPGSVSQVKECASQLNRFAKETNTTLIIICHVTKDGEFAGPRALEHIVDTVLYFEGDKNNNFRMIRAFKNRFGPINEVGIFSMGQTGLECVDDPSGVFISGNKKLPGASIYVSQEGNRSILVEVQSLLDKTPLPNPVRRSIGLDSNRLQMLCAVIHRYVDLPIYTHNVFVSTIGGMKFNDTGIDLPSFMSMISSYRNTPIKNGTALFGEIGLTGELRQVQNFEDRIKEASRLGIKSIIMPKSTSKKKIDFKAIYGIEVVECADLESAIIASF